MKRNIALEVAFDGTAYCGWQRQKEQRTIQGELEAAVIRLTGENSSVHGAGRTDAGVHALAMTAAFFTEGNIPADGILRGLNSILPDDIVVIRAIDAGADFHPRKSAVGKVYAYRLSFAFPALPTERLYCWQMSVKPDIEAMQTCMARLVGRHDFSSFEASGSRDPRAEGRGAVRTIFTAGLAPSGDDGVIIRVSGDGFLRHMVRNIVGTLIEAGRGRMSAEEFAAVMAAKDRAAAGPTAPARGLFLEKVFYKF